jgi:inosine/xanthosine triphosphate pyrophosphatase family protein
MPGKETITVLGLVKDNSRRTKGTNGFGYDPSFMYRKKAVQWQNYLLMKRIK